LQSESFAMKVRWYHDEASSLLNQIFLVGEDEVFAF